MGEWWVALTTIEKFFATIAIPSTLILLLQTILLLFSFGGGMGEADSGELSDDLSDSSDSDIFDVGLRLFTVRGFVAFFTVFGWSGLVLLKSDVHMGISIIVAVILGFVSMTFIAVMIMLFMKLQANGVIKIENAVGISGTTYITIPANRDGMGKVTALVSGTFTEFDAVTDSDEAIATGSSVLVVAVTGGNTLVVQKK